MMTQDKKKLTVRFELRESKFKSETKQMSSIVSDNSKVDDNIKRKCQSIG